MAVAQRAASPAGPENESVKHPYSLWPNWAYPTLVVVALTAFGLYTLYDIFFQRRGFADPYLSPIYSPRIWQTGPLPPSIWVVWAPLAFRASCYYYRKAGYRGYFWHPRACAVPEHENSRYRGETVFPFVLANLHRFALYAIVLQVIFLYYDVFRAFDFQGRLGFGLGTALMVVNIALVSGYTFGCHAVRHLVGGNLDCFSCSRTRRARHRLWKGVTVLNVRHDYWAWASLVSIWLVDLYIHLLQNGVLHDPRLVF